MAIDSNVPIVTNQVSADLTAMANNMKLIVCGDGTAGRVLRLSKLTIANGSTLHSVKVKLDSIWNGDDIAEEDELNAGGDTGFFSWIDNSLYIDKTGIAGDVIACLDTTIYKRTGLGALNPSVLATESDGNMRVFLFDDATGSIIQPTYFDSGDEVIVYITYLTSA